MQRNEFLTELREGLSEQLSIAELEDIINDYHEFFEDGHMEGKTEQEICTELGSPAKVAKLILAGEYAERGIVQAGHINPTRHEKLPYAPVSSRILAAMIDHVLAVFPLAFFGIISILPFMMMWPPIVMYFAVEPTPASAGKTVAAIACLVYFVIYHPVFLLFLQGRTPGKLLFNLCVVNKDGTPLTITKVVARELLGRMLVVSFTFGVSHVVSLFWCLFSREHRTVHDAIADTCVILTSARHVKE